MIRNPGIAIAALLSCAACSTHVTMVGFPAYEVEDAQDEASELFEDVVQIEAAIEDHSSPGGDVASSEAKHAYRALLAAHLALSNEHFVYEEEHQVASPGRPPLFLYPRLTMPAIVEPVLAESAPSRGANPVHKWFVPAILSKDAVYFDRSAAKTWLGWEPPQRDYDRPRLCMRGFLERHGDMPLSERNPIPTQPYLLDIGPLDVSLSSEVQYQLPSVHPNWDAFVLAIPVAAPGGDDSEGVAPGFYDLRVYPMIAVDGLRDPLMCRLGEAIAEGDWHAAIAIVREIPPELDAGRLAAMRADSASFGAGIDAYVPTYFDEELDIIRRAFSLFGEEGGTLERDRARFVLAIRELLTSNRHPMPVSLCPPAAHDEPFTFVVAADTQYRGNMTRVAQFLHLIDNRINDRGHGAAQRNPMISAEIADELSQARFVVINGDLADGAGLSSSPGKIYGNALGLLSPLSPYEEEFDDLRRELLKFRRPVFAVPGNHDGFASYGGFVNNVVDSAGSALQLKTIEPISTITHSLGEGLRRVARHFPVLFKIFRFGTKPFFDGLVEWRYQLGPHNFAFQYRGHSFVGINSYNLDVKYRDQIGALANNWGGGVTRHDAVWFDVMLRWLQWRARRFEEADHGKHQFVFIHHDPRAARPFQDDFEEDDFGGYDTTDAFFNALTFGYLGVGYSPQNPLWLPLLSPIMNNAPKHLFLGNAKFNQEWMKDGALTDGDNYGARQLIEAINANLAGRPGSAGGISHIFFGHDDIPATSEWIHGERGDAVFPPPGAVEWPDSEYGLATPLTPFFRLRSSAPPEWAREMRIADGRNAVVLRCDDVGQRDSTLHGIYLVKVDPSKPAGSDVTVQWIQIP